MIYKKKLYDVEVYCKNGHTVKMENARECYFSELEGGNWCIFNKQTTWYIDNENIDAIRMEFVGYEEPEEAAKE